MDKARRKNILDKNPMNEPIAGFIELFADLPSIISPINAPNIGPIIIPTGGNKNNPIINPIPLPHTPFFDPLNLLVAYIGKTLSITADSMANPPNIIRNSTENGCLDEN